MHPSIAASAFEQIRARVSVLRTPEASADGPFELNYLSPRNVQNNDEDDMVFSGFTLMLDAIEKPITLDVERQYTDPLLALNRMRIQNGHTEFKWPKV